MRHEQCVPTLTSYCHVQDSFRDLYRLGELDSRKVVVDIPSARITVNAMDGPGGQALQVCLKSSLSQQLTTVVSVKKG